MAKRKGFTLVELLIAATIFVVIAAFSITSLTSTLRLQTSQKRSQDIISQTQSAINIIQSDFQQSNEGLTRIIPLPSVGLNPSYDSYNNTPPPLTTAPYTAPTFNLYPDDTMLVLAVPNRDAAGKIYGTNIDYHIYCAEDQFYVDNANNLYTIGKRIVRYILPYSSSPQPSNSTYFQQDYRFRACTKGTVGALYYGTTNPTPAQVITQYLTDPTDQILFMRMQAVWSKTRTGPLNPLNNSYNDMSDALRIEVAAQYNAINTASALNGQVSRSSDTKYAASPIVLRSLVERSNSRTRLYTNNKQ